MNTLVPKIPQLTYANTSANWVLDLQALAALSLLFTDIDLDVENNFRDAEKKIFGKTNETGLAAVSGSKKSLVLKGILIY